MKKIKYIELLPIIIISFIAFRLLNDKILLSDIWNYTIVVFTPFFWALGIAYIINIAMRSFENKFKMRREFSLPLSFVIILMIIVLFFIVLIPMLIDTIPNVVADTASFSKEFDHWYSSNMAGKIDLFSSQSGMDLNKIIKDQLQNVLSFITGLLQGLLSSLGTLIHSMTKLIINFFIGLVVAIYVLNDKENFCFRTRKLFTAFLGEKFTNKTAEILDDTDVIFANYLVAKSLDSLIVAIIALIGFKLIGLEHSFLFAIIIGITNMIPYFGPIIGAVPVILITLFFSPMKALWATVFILALQQVDGNIIGPKIVDEKMGLPPLWGVVSVTVGGALFGFLGMLLGTPVFAVIRKIILDVQNEKLVKKGLYDKFKES